MAELTREWALALGISMPLNPTTIYPTPQSRQLFPPSYTLLPYLVDRLLSLCGYRMAASSSRPFGSPAPSLSPPRPPPFVALVVAPASRTLPSTLTGTIGGQPGPSDGGPSSPSSPSTGTPLSSISSFSTPPSSASPTVAAFGTRAPSSSSRTSGRKSKRPSTSAAVLAANAVPDGTKVLTLAQALSLGGAQGELSHPALLALVRFRASVPDPSVRTTG